jgi:rubrerythrin
MSQASTQPSWRCTECGFTLQADQPPQICPMCRAQCEFHDISCYLPECGGPGGIDPRLK